MYRRTDAGRKAWECPASGLPEPYRQILGLLKTTMRSTEVLSGMHGFPAKKVLDWLDELETLCFIEPVSRKSLPQAA